MAAVLPYPNMDFTPLDVLTAAEMDQMVANDKYLADFCTGLANGTNLENGMIPLRKLKPNYSKEPIEIGTWIDGRKIYRKVYFGKGDVPKEVSVINCATVIDMRMVVKNKANNGSWRTVPWLYDTTDNTWVAGFYMDSLRKVVVMQLKNNMASAYWWHLVIDYCIDVSPE